MTFGYNIQQSGLPKTLKDAKTVSSQDDLMEEAIARAKTAFVGSLAVGMVMLFLLFALYKKGYVQNKSELAALIQALVGSFFSLASGVIVFMAFLAQTRQLALQKQQIKEEAEEGEKTRLFDTLFRLINTYNTVVSDLDLRRREKLQGHAVIAKGRDCFLIFYGRMRDAFQSRASSDILEAYDSYFQDVRSDLSGYLNQANLIIRLISMVADQQIRDSMADVFRAQLTDHEMVLLCYDTSFRGSAEARDAALRAGIFRILRSDLVMHDTKDGLIDIGKRKDV